MGNYGVGYLNTEFGSGTTILNELPEATSSSYFYGALVFEPEGVPVGSANFLYLTDSPHFRHGAEAYIAYDSGTPSFTVFDWNPLVHDWDALEAPGTGAGTKFGLDVNDSFFTPYKKTTTWGGGSREYMYVYNQSLKLTNGKWRNDVWLYKWGTGWVIVWDTDIDYDKDPAVDGWPNGHALWAGALEEFGSYSGWGDKKTGIFSGIMNVDGVSYNIQISDPHFHYRSSDSSSNLVVSDISGTSWLGKAS